MAFASCLASTGTSTHRLGSPRDSVESASGDVTPATCDKSSLALEARFPHDPPASPAAATTTTPIQLSSNSGVFRIRYTPPEPQQRIMAKLFGGPVLDIDHAGNSTWKKTYPIDGSGKLTAPHSVRQSFEDKGLPLRALGEAASAACRIYVPTCRCRQKDPSLPIPVPTLNHDSTMHKQVAMSGFWIEGDKLVTCAHLLSHNTKDPNEIGDTANFLQSLSTMEIESASADMRMRAVSSDVAEEHSLPQGETIHVYLDQWDEVSDIAILKPVKAETTKPKHTIMFTHLVDILSVANAPNMNLFSVHYPGENFPVSEWDVTPDRMTNKKTNRHYESVFEALATERSNKSTAQLKQGPAIPPFQKVFAPETRSVGVGSLSGISSALPKGNIVLIDHNIPGWFGSSGGMVGLVSQSDSQVYIIGLFNGEGDLDNQLVAFTQTTIDNLKQA